MSLIRKNNVQEEMNNKKNASQSALIAEQTEEEHKINLLIREKYSMSQELELHRKKLNGVLPDETWEEYNAYVEECIRQVREDEPNRDNEPAL